MVIHTTATTRRQACARSQRHRHLKTESLEKEDLLPKGVLLKAKKKKRVEVILKDGEEYDKHCKSRRLVNLSLSEELAVKTKRGGEGA